MFSLPASQDAPSITTGPDGNLWYYTIHTAQFGRVSTSGKVTQLAQLAPGFAIVDIAASSDGYLWIADEGNNVVWRLDSRTGATKEYPLTSTDGKIQGVAIGRDGSIWAATYGDNPLIRIDPRTGAARQYAVPDLTSLSYGLAPIIAAPDGTIWFAPGGNTEWIGRIDPKTGAIKTFDIPHEGYTASPQSLAIGPDGSVWFVCNTSASSGDVVGRVTPAGQVKAYNLTIGPQVIASGPDGNLWFSTANGFLTRVTSAGAVTEFHSIPAMGGVALGPDGHLWVTFRTSSGSNPSPTYIARLDHLP